MVTVIILFYLLMGVYTGMRRVNFRARVYHQDTSLRS